MLYSVPKIYDKTSFNKYYRNVLQVKANSVKQEYEKQEELKRSAMRAVAALMMVPGAGKK